MNVCPACHHGNPRHASICESCQHSLELQEDLHRTTKAFVEGIGTFSPGDLIANRYEIVSELGQGGMGAVYLVKESGLRDIG